LPASSSVLALVPQALLAAAGPASSSPAPLHALVLVCLAVALGEAWNLAGGLADRPSLGHAAFFGVGAYGVLVLARAGVNPWIDLGLAAAGAGLLGAALGAATVRLSAPAFALATLALAELLRSAAALAPGLGGLDGHPVPAPPPLELLWLVPVAPERAILGAAVALAAGAVWLTHTVKRARLGLGLAALAEHADAARALGISPVRHRSAALALSAAVTALAGGLGALHAAAVGPADLSLAAVSVPAALVCLLGGSGRAAGPVVGALVVAPLHLVLTEPRTLVQLGLLAPGGPALSLLERHGGGLALVVEGLLLAGVALFLPHGLLDLPGRLARRHAPAVEIATE
jgi:branched-chain amino acid transport system permease protein